MAVQAESQKIDIFIQVMENIPFTINSDQLRIRQIVINLIGNAIKFTKSGYIIIVVEYI